MKIIFAAGGTAGHINPALAIADFISEHHINAEILFIGTERGLEKKLINKNKYEIKFIDVQGFNRKNIFKNFITLKKIFTSIKESKKIIKNFNPQVVMGTGGYVTGPVIYCAHRLKIPTVIHESNSLPGLTTKILANFADITCLGFPEGKKFLRTKKHKKKVIVTGNPIKPEFLKICKSSARKKLNLDKRPFILVFGGSLGAEKLNEIIINFVAKIAPEKKIQMLICVGKKERISTFYSKLEKLGITKINNPQIKIIDYIYDMEYAMNAADLIISRSGAITISEIIALKKPSILIPSPNVTNNHQEHNAKVVANMRCAIMIKENDLNDDVLLSSVNNILKENKIQEIEEKFSKIKNSNALEKIHEILIKISKLIN